MKILSLMCFSTLFYSCGSSHCSGTAEINRYTFQKHLTVVKQISNKRKAASMGEFDDATLYLSIVTGISSKAGYSSTFGYQSKADYKKDLSNWKNWYKKNKCKLTEHYIDSAYESVKLKRK